MSMQPPDHHTVAERRLMGQDIRKRLPRSGHAAWSAPDARPDPVATLIESGRGRIAELLPIRYGRMQDDAFAFLRGSASVMAWDIASQPDTGLRVQSCGDCHHMNMGAFASPEGQPVFDINDFDETLPAPFEWDLKRLAASLAVAGRAHGLPDKTARGLARRAGHAYRRHIHELAVVPPLEAWQSRVALEDAIEGIGEKDTKRRERVRLYQAINASASFYREVLTPDGALRLPHRPPVMHRMDPLEPTASTAFAAYLDTLAEERRVLVQRYRLRDLAFKAVGVGSVGTFCAIGLFATADGDVLLLQLKEAQRSVLAAHAGDSRYTNQGERVVVGQRIMQAVSDVFLGWAQGGPEGRHFYVRQLKDPRLAAVGSRLGTDALAFYARLCGLTLARAHARSGDAAMIAGYLGDGDAFDDALAAFAIAYADQNDADFAAFTAAIHEGRIEARKEPI